MKTFVALLILVQMTGHTDGLDISDDMVVVYNQEVYGEVRGTFRNCGKSQFYFTWSPDPMLIKENVTVEGNYTFPKDFKGVGNMTVTLGSLPPESLPFICQAFVSGGNCTEGRTINVTITEVVPPLPTRVVNVPLTIKIIDMTGYEFLCAKAVISIK